jgi:hypothetical protein
MATAMIYPEPEKGGRGKLSRNRDGLEGNEKTWKNRLSQARTVLKHLPEMAKKVVAGDKPLDAAYTVDQRRGS